MHTRGQSFGVSIGIWDALLALSNQKLTVKEGLGARNMTTLPPLCLPLPLRSAISSPWRSCCSWPLVARSLFPLQALSRMDRRSRCLPCSWEQTLAGLVGRSPFRSPTEPAFRLQAGGAESGCVRGSLVPNSDGHPRFETLFISVSSCSPPLLHYSSVLAGSSSPLSSNSFYCIYCFTLCYSAADNDNLMTPTKPSTIFLRRAREKGSENNRVGIDGTKVHRRLDPDTKRIYDATMTLWIE